MKENQDTLGTITGATIVKADFGELDKLIGGLQPNELTILAARPGTDVSALAQAIANNVAIKDEQIVLFVSLEMTKLELSLRLICSHAKLDIHEVRSNSLSKEEHGLLVNAFDELAKSPMYIDDTSRTVADISAVAQRLKQEKGLKLIVIDHIGLITSENPDEPRQEQVAVIVQRLRELAEKLHVPVLGLNH